MILSIKYLIISVCMSMIITLIIIATIKLAQALTFLHQYYYPTLHQYSKSQLINNEIKSGKISKHRSVKKNGKHDKKAELVEE